MSTTLRRLEPSIDLEMSAIRSLDDKFFVCVLVAVLFTACVADGDRRAKEESGKCRNKACTESNNNLSLCIINEDCLSSQVCCRKACVASWSCREVIKCSLDNDCQKNETCCSGICTSGEGPCDEKSDEGPDVAMIIMLCLMSISFLIFCYCGCKDKHLADNRRWFPSLSLSSQATLITSLTRSLEAHSNQRLNMNGLSWPSRKLKVHFYVPSIYNPPPISSKKQEKAAESVRTWYGATCDTV